MDKTEKTLGLIRGHIVSKDKDIIKKVLTVATLESGVNMEDYASNNLPFIYKNVKKLEISFNVADMVENMDNDDVSSIIFGYSENLAGNEAVLKRLYKILRAENSKDDESTYYIAPDIKSKAIGFCKLYLISDKDSLGEAVTETEDSTSYFRSKYKEVIHNDNKLRDLIEAFLGEEYCFEDTLAYLSEEATLSYLIESSASYDLMDRWVEDRVKKHFKKFMVKGTSIVDCEYYKTILNDCAKKLAYSIYNKYLNSLQNENNQSGIMDASDFNFELGGSNDDVGLDFGSDTGGLDFNSDAGGLDFNSDAGGLDFNSDDTGLNPGLTSDSDSDGFNLGGAESTLGGSDSDGLGGFNDFSVPTDTEEEEVEDNGLGGIAGIANNKEKTLGTEKKEYLTIKDSQLRHVLAIAQLLARMRYSHMSAIKHGYSGSSSTLALLDAKIGGSIDSNLAIGSDNMNYIKLSFNSLILESFRKSLEEINADAFIKLSGAIKIHCMDIPDELKALKGNFKDNNIADGTEVIIDGNFGKFKITFNNSGANVELVDDRDSKYDTKLESIINSALISKTAIWSRIILGRHIAGLIDISDLIGDKDEDDEDGNDDNDGAQSKLAEFTMDKSYDTYVANRLSGIDLVEIKDTEEYVPITANEDELKEVSEKFGSLAPKYKIELMSAITERNISDLTISSKLKMGGLFNYLAGVVIENKDEFKDIAEPIQRMCDITGETYTHSAFSWSLGSALIDGNLRCKLYDKILDNQDMTDTVVDCYYSLLYDVFANAFNNYYSKQELLELVDEVVTKVDNEQLDKYLTVREFSKLLFSYVSKFGLSENSPIIKDLNLTGLGIDISNKAHDSDMVYTLKLINRLAGVNENNISQDRLNEEMPHNELVEKVYTRLYAEVYLKHAIANTISPTEFSAFDINIDLWKYQIANLDNLLNAQNTNFGVNAGLRNQMYKELITVLFDLTGKPEEYETLNNYGTHAKLASWATEVPNVIDKYSSNALQDINKLLDVESCAASYLVSNSLGDFILSRLPLSLDEIREMESTAVELFPVIGSILEHGEVFSSKTELGAWFDLLNADIISNEALTVIISAYIVRNNKAEKFIDKAAQEANKNIIVSIDAKRCIPLNARIELFKKPVMTIVGDYLPIDYCVDKVEKINAMAVNDLHECNNLYKAINELNSHIGMKAHQISVGKIEDNEGLDAFNARRDAEQARIKQEEESRIRKISIEFLDKHGDKQTVDYLYNEKNEEENEAIQVFLKALQDCKRSRAPFEKDYTEVVSSIRFWDVNYTGEVDMTNVTKAMQKLKTRLQFKFIKDSEGKDLHVWKAYDN